MVDHSLSAESACIDRNEEDNSCREPSEGRSESFTAQSRGADCNIYFF